MFNFLKKILFVSLPFVLLIAGINYFIDAAYIFNDGKFEKSVASILAKNHNYQGTLNYDERLVFEQIAIQMDSAPEIMIFGTSRVLGFDSKNFPKSTSKNFALSHANFNDFVAQIGLLDSLQKLPKEIYFDVTCFLSSKVEGEKWKVLCDYQKYLVNKLNLMNIQTINSKQSYFIKKKFEALFSLDYFQTCLKKRNQKSKSKVIDIDTNEIIGSGKYADGSISKNAFEIIQDTVKLMNNAQLFVTLEGIPEIDHSKIENFKLISAYLKKKGIKINLVIIPHQTDSYNYLNIYFSHLENDLIDFANQNNFGLYGTFNPSTLGLSRKDFVDNLHSNKITFEKVLSYKLR